MSEQTLTHGRIVEFRLDGGPNAGQYRPAMVVRVWTDECAQLEVHTDRSNDGPDPFGAEWFRSVGAPRVVLWTADKNQGAQRLFTRLGFRRTMIEMTRELEHP